MIVNIETKISAAKSPIGSKPSLGKVSHKLTKSNSVNSRENKTSDSRFTKIEIGIISRIKR